MHECLSFYCCHGSLLSRLGASVCTFRALAQLTSVYVYVQVLLLSVMTHRFDLQLLMD